MRITRSHPQCGRVERKSTMAESIIGISAGCFLYSIFVATASFALRPRLTTRNEAGTATDKMSVAGDFGRPQIPCWLSAERVSCAISPARCGLCRVRFRRCDMGWKLDIKSAVVGGVVVAVAAIFLGAAKSEPTVRRYQVTAGASYAYIIDTMTGQAWQVMQGQNSTSFFEPKTEGSK